MHRQRRSVRGTHISLKDEAELIHQRLSESTACLSPYTKRRTCSLADISSKNWSRRAISPCCSSFSSSSLSDWASLSRSRLPVFCLIVLSGDPTGGGEDSHLLRYVTTGIVRGGCLQSRNSRRPLRNASIQSGGEFRSRISIVIVFQRCTISPPCRCAAKRWTSAHNAARYDSHR